jgi:hypothetical protein
MTGFSQDDLRSACAAAYGLIAECEERMAAGEQLTDEEEKDLAAARALAGRCTSDGRRKSAE